MKAGIVVMLLVMSVFVGACNYIDGPTTTLIDQQATLAKQVASNAQAQSDCPAGLKAYLKSDAESWQYFSDTAHNRKATVTP